MMEGQIRKSSLVLLLGLAGFVVMADNWVISPNGFGLILTLGLSFLLFREEAPMLDPVVEDAAGELQTEGLEIRSGLLE